MRASGAALVEGAWVVELAATFAGGLGAAGARDAPIKFGKRAPTSSWRKRKRPTLASWS